MNKELFEIISSKYQLKEIDMGDYKTLNKKGMHFVFSCYELAGVGHISVFSMKAMFGLMKMESIVINPFEVDAPLFSFDLIDVMGNRTLLTENYNTQLGDISLEKLVKVKESYPMLQDGEAEHRWYDHLKMESSLVKKGKTKQPEFASLLIDYLKAYLEVLDDAKKCDEDKKRAKAKEYTEGLLNNGGPAVDQITKLIGKERTGVLFRDYLFGTK